MGGSLAGSSRAACLCAGLSAAAGTVRAAALQQRALKQKGQPDMQRSPMLQHARWTMHPACPVAQSRRGDRRELRVRLLSARSSKPAFQRRAVGALAHCPCRLHTSWCRARRSSARVGIFQALPRVRPPALGTLSPLRLAPGALTERCWAPSGGSALGGLRSRCCTARQSAAYRAGLEASGTGSAALAGLAGERDRESERETVRERGEGGREGGSASPS